MIQSIRKKNDRKYFDVVEPHVTLVFGTEKLSADELAEFVRKKLSSYGAFSLKFDSYKIVEDDSKDFYHAFLIPSNGFNEINKIHDLLYTDELKSELRHDIPFIPHLGIGSGTEVEMGALVKELYSSQLVINGVAEEITIVQYNGKRVSDHSTVKLS